MPAISMFYGLVVYMYFIDNKQHKLPHIHVQYQNDEVIVSIPDGQILEGGIPGSKMKLLQTWIELHKAVEVIIMNPRVKLVTASSDYTLHIEFTNGEHGVYDCSPLLDFGVFRELKDLNYFKQARVLDGTVVWPHEQDICPDTLYLDSTRRTEQGSPAAARTSRG